MEHDNGSRVAQNIAPNGTGHQQNYSGQGQQFMNGSGTINNFIGTLPNLDDAREELLRALNTSQYLQGKNRNHDRVPGTCEWFIKHDVFRDWRDSTSSSILWVSANPGCGKSVLAKCLVDELKTTEKRTTCYFFFKDDFEDQRSAKSALSCILHQLFTQNENLLSTEIIKRFRSYKAPPANSYYELWELWDILIMATQEENAGEIVCILDAFDECVDQERQDLGKILREFYGKSGDTKKNVNLKFLITSRPYDAIRRVLITTECPVIHLKGDDDAEVEKIAAEISLYIKDRVTHIQRESTLNLSPNEEKILLQGLEAIPNRTYLWVYLTLDWIEHEIRYKINEAEIRNAISILPRTVDEAYNKILAKSTDVEETRKLLHIVVAAERPLTLAEMDLALLIREDHKSYEDLGLRPPKRVNEYIRELCGLFINITDGKIYLLHQTAKEFLVHRDSLMGQDHGINLTWKFSLVPVRSHRIMCKICIWHLLLNEIKLRSSAEILTDYVRDNIFLDYSAKNWARHFRESNIKENEIVEQLHQLSNVTPDRCPTWFEIYWTNIHREAPLNFTKLMIASNFGLEMIVSQIIESPDTAMDSVDGSHQRTALSLASENGFDGVVQLLIKGPRIHAKEAFKKATRRTFSRRVKVPAKKTFKTAIRLSISRGANINTKDKYGRTALFYAAWNGHMTIVQILVKAGARVDAVDSIGGTPISYALCYGHEGIANELMRGAQPDSVDKIRRQLIFSAMKHDHDLVVKRLLDSGADPEAIDNEGFSLMVLATAQGKTNIITLLIEKGADINKGSRYGRTPLMSAAEEGKPNIVELLIEKGADINKRDEDGKTALMSAFERGRTNIVGLLIEKGADINMSDREGKTPLILAVKEGNPNIVELLIGRGADVNKGSLYGTTPLTAAVEGRNTNIIELLIERGADVNKGGRYGRTPLILAAERGETITVELLVERGADVNKRDDDGKTPLIFAMQRLFTSIDPHLATIESHLIEMLLKGGVRVDYFCRNVERAPWGFGHFTHGITPLLYAIEWSNDKLVDLLLKYGADPNFVGGCRFTPLEAAKIRRHNLKAKLERLEDDMRSGLVRNKRDARNVASSNAIIQMLEDANRVR